MNKKKLHHVLLFLIAALFSVQSFSQVNYYVATNGNDNNAGTSLAAPFATIAKAVAKATVAGDTIFVRSGTYTVSATVRITRSGTAAKHIVLTVYKPDMVDANSRPVFDFTGMAVSSSNRGFQVSGVSYWDFYGIIIKGAGDNGLIIDGGGDYNTLGGGYITVEFCGFTRNRDTGFQIGGRAHNITVINCDSYENADLGTGTTTLGGNADGFTPKIDPGDTIIYRGCRAWLNSDDGWDGYLKVLAGENGEAGNEPDNMTTFLEDCWSFNNGYYWLDHSTTTSENGNGIKMGGSANKNEAHNFVVIKCLSFDNKAKGFDQNNSAGSQYIYNCTAFNNGDVDYGLNSTGVTYEAGAQLVIENCLSLGPKGVALPSGSTSTRMVTTATNSFSTSTKSPEILSFDTTGVTAMRKLDGSLPDINFMHLNTAASQPFTYIDKGTVLTTVVYHNITGIPYNGAAPDLGAFESSFASDVVYVFTGAGNWTDPANWQQNTIPPSSLPANSTISINGSGNCILDTTQTIMPGGILIVQPNKQFTIPNNLMITQ